MQNLEDVYTRMLEMGWVEKIHKKDMAEGQSGITVTWTPTGEKLMVALNDIFSGFERGRLMTPNELSLLRQTVHAKAFRGRIEPPGPSSLGPGR